MSVENENRADRWIPRLFVAFFAGLVTLQTVFVVIAFRTFPGVATDHPYERGRQFNTLLDDAASQSKIGLSVQIVFTAAAGQEGVVSVAVKDSLGAPIAGASVTVLAERLTRHAQALHAVLADSGDGSYAAPFSLPIGGRWSILARVTVGEFVHRESRDIHVAVRGGMQ